MDELVEQTPEPVKLQLQLFPLTLGSRQQQLLQLHGQALLGVLLRQLLPFHARRPLVTKNLKVQFVSFYFKMALTKVNFAVFDLQDLQILMPLISPSLSLFLNQALRHFFEVW